MQRRHRTQLSGPRGNQRRASDVGSLTDAAVRLSRLRVDAGGAKTWPLAFTRPETNARTRLTLDRYADLALAKAREKAVTERAHIAEGTDPVRERAACRVAMTVADLVDDYLARRAGRNCAPARRSSGASERTSSPRSGR